MYGARVEVTDHRTKVDWAYAVRDLVDLHYPDAELITLVMDNLNTHSLGSLYAAFEPIEAKRLADRLEIHYTPKQGSWLNEALIRARGASILWRPAYSPDFSPIEHAFSKLKAWRRRVKALSQEALEQALAEGLAMITEMDALSWFIHCGHLNVA